MISQVISAFYKAFGQTFIKAGGQDMLYKNIERSVKNWQTVVVTEC
jgi:hypothetical protein